MRIIGFNRIELLLPAAEIGRAAEAFADLLGVRIDPPERLAQHHVLTATAWEAGLELIAPGDATSGLHRLLEGKGPGVIGPIVWQVEDLDPIRSHAESLGCQIAHELATPNGGRQISLARDDCYGYALSFIERPPEPPPGPAARITRFDRVELLLPAEDLDGARTFFATLLGIDIPPFEYMPEHHVRTTLCAQAGIELFGPGDDESALNALLQVKGRRGAIGPIVWRVSDLERMKAHALALGHRVVYELSFGDRRQFCLGPDTLFGYMATFTQLVEAGARPL